MNKYIDFFDTSLHSNIYRSIEKIISNSEYKSATDYEKF